METSELFKGRKNDEKTSMQVTFGFLRFLEKFRGKRESYEQTMWRLITSKDLNSEDKQIIKEAKKDYSQFLG